MQINKVYTYNKLQVIIDGIKSRINEGLNIAVITKDSTDTALVFGSVQPFICDDNAIVNSRDRKITIGDTQVRFYKADWPVYCGMHFDVLFIDSEVEQEEVLRAISRVRGANNKEKSCYILYNLKEFTEEHSNAKTTNDT